MAKKIINIIAGGFLFLFLLIASTLIVIQTKPFKAWLAKTIAQTASRQINAELEIGLLEGDFFSRLELHDIKLHTRGDTLAHIENIQINYSAFSLINRRLVIDSLIIASPRFSLHQNQDSVWVFSDLVPPSSDSTETTETTKKRMSIDINYFAFRDGDVRLNSLYKALPKRITGINIKSSAHMSHSKRQLSLEHFAFKTYEPEFELKELSFGLLMDEASARLENVVVRTGKNKLLAQANVDTSDVKNGALEAEIKDFDASELIPFIPSLEMMGRPTIAMQATVRDDHFFADVALSSKQSRISVTANLENYSALLRDPASTDSPYEINIALQNVTASDFVIGSSLSGLLNVEANINGVGVDVQTAVADADIKVFDSIIADRRIDSLSTNIHYNQGDVESSINLHSPSGSLSADIQLDEVFGAFDYSASLYGHKIDLQHLLLDEQATSSLTFNMMLNGSGRRADVLKSSIVIQMDSSQVMDIPIDSFFVSGRINSDEFVVEALLLKSLIADIEGSGQASLENESDMTFELSLKNPAPLSMMISADTLAAGGIVKARIRGVRDSLVVNTTIAAHSISFNDVAIDTVSADAIMEFESNMWTVSGTTDLTNIKAADSNIKHVHVAAGFRENNLDSRVNITVADDLTSSFQIKYLTSDVPQLLIPTIDIHAKGEEWHGEELSLRFENDSIWFDNVLLTNTMLGDAKTLRLNGVFSKDGEEDLEFSISNLNLSLPMSFVPGMENVNGDMDLRIKIIGAAAEPEVSAFLKISNGRFNNYTMKRIESTAHYKNSALNMNTLIAPTADSIQISAIAPMIFSLSPPQFLFDKNAPLDVQLITKNFSLKQVITQNESPQFAAGDLSMDFKVDNSWADAKTNGYAQLENGRIAFDKLGLLFENIRLNIGVNPDSVVLRKLSAQRDRGMLNIDGFALPSKDFSKGIINDFKLMLVLDKFMLSSRPEHKIEVSSNIALVGPPNAAKISGQLNILQSSFYLPALIKGNSERKPLDEPLLLQVVSTNGDSLSEAAPDSIDIKIIAPDALKNMRGKVNIRIPKNTWIKSDNMRIELAGDFDVLKESEDITLAGEINVLRGQIDYLARRFIIKRGEVVFQNRKHIDPVIDLAAEYVFRDIHSKKRTLSLITTGNLSAPAISFLLDENEITTEEAVSYLLFQRAPGELGMDQHASSNAQTEKMATNFLYGMASSRLSKRIGSTLGLDYMEIKGQENWNSTTFVMGKYLTPDLFVSYEHSVGTLEEDRKPHVMTVEYELTKHLFLQLISGDTKTTGADVIFKVSK